MVVVQVTVNYDNNFTNLEDIMANAPEELKSRVVEILQHGAENIVRDSKARAPVKTGALQEHIFHIITETGANIICGVYYASFQEYGTIRIVPKHFVSQSFDWHVPEITNQITECIINYFERNKR